MKDIIAEIRELVVSSQAMIKLVARGKKTEPQALVEIATNLLLIYELLKRANGK